MAATLAGSLFVDQGAVATESYEDCYCSLDDQGVFTAFLRIRADKPSSITNKKDIAVDFQLKPGFCDVKISRVSISALSRLRRNGNKDLPPSPFFFVVNIFDADKGQSTYKFATSSEADRSQWVGAFKAIGQPVELQPRGEKNDAILPRSARKKTRKPTDQERDRAQIRDPALPQNKKSVTPGPRPLKHVNMIGMGPPVQAKKAKSKQGGLLGFGAGTAKQQVATADLLAMSEENEENEEKENKASERRFLGIKIVNVVRFLQVLAGFPFAIIIGTIVQPSPRLYWMKKKWFLYLGNLLWVFGIPLLLVQFVLKEYTVSWIQRVTIGGYLLIFYGIPILLYSARKIQQMSSTDEIVDGAFSFKPSSRARWTFANFLQFLNFFFEWFQLVLMMLPSNLLTENSSLYMKSYPPYLSFQYYFWLCVGLTYASTILLMMLPVLRGKVLYQYKNNPFSWNLIFAVGNFLFLPIVTIMFMSLWCDYTDAKNPTFLQDEDVACYTGSHLLFARCGLITLGFLIIQHVLIPAGTYKETIGQGLDIIFVPNYLSMHAMMKVIFAGVYVLFYTWDIVRIPLLVATGFIMLLLNMGMKPCSVKSVNVLKDTIFIHLCITGIISLNFAIFNEVYGENEVSGSNATRYMTLSTIGANIACSALAMGVYYFFSQKHTETLAAANLVELENSNDTTVGFSSRIMEPLISITIIDNPDDLAKARKYIPKLVKFIEFPAPRVQFQAVWALANLCLYDEQARVEIHDAGGTKTLLDNFYKQQVPVQLETLAALANLSLSQPVAEALVRRYNCLAFLMDLIGSKKMKHSLFALICLCNLSKREMFREQIRYSYGIESIISCLMSHDYNKRKFGALALSNMALSSSEDIETVFQTRGLIERIVKMAKRKEVETQREIVALVRNLACHSRLRPVLLDSGIMHTLEAFRSSVHEGVAKWTDEISILMQREITMGNFADSKLGGSASSSKLRSRSAALEAEVIQSDKDFLKSMQPLDARVEWSTWGSKLDGIFQPLVQVTPCITRALTVEVDLNEAVVVYLPDCLDELVLLKWRDDVSFLVTSSPSNGKVTTASNDDNTENIDEDSVLYKPKKDFQGEDKFSYVVKFGENVSSPCVVTVVVGGSMRGSEGCDDEQDLAERGENYSGTSSHDENDGEEDSEDSSNSATPGGKPKSRQRDTFARVMGDTIHTDDRSQRQPRHTPEAISDSPQKRGLFSRWGREDKDDYPEDEYANTA